MNPVHVARLIADALERAGLDYAIGGAIAGGYWGLPRGTYDVDITVYAGVDEFDRIAGLLVSAGCELDRESERASVLKRGLGVARYQGVRVDVYFPDIELYRDAYPRRKIVDLEGRPAFAWSAEVLTVFKLLYFRLKDRADIEAIWERQRPNFDAAFVRGWLLRAVGEGDERTRWWDSIVARRP